MENTDLSQTNVLISIGSNLGDRLKYIELAIMEIKNIPTLILGKSNIIETKALEVLDQPADSLFYSLINVADLQKLRNRRN